MGCHARMALRWTLASEGCQASEDGAQIRHSREGPDGAASALFMASGHHVVTLTVDASERNAGFLYLGVVAADGRTGDWPSPHYRQQQQNRPSSSAAPPPPVAWGFCPLNGHLHATDHPSGWGVRRRKLMAGDLSGRAVGAVVRMHVDMDNRTLSFAINGGELSDSQVHLPAAVRPWVLLAHRGDAVTLTGYRGPALVRSAVAAHEWLRLSLPPTLREHERSAVGSDRCDIMRDHVRCRGPICAARPHRWANRLVVIGSSPHI